MVRTSLGVALVSTALVTLAPGVAQAAPAPGSPQVQLVVPSTVSQRDGAFQVRQSWSYPASAGAICSADWQYFAPNPSGGWDFVYGGNLAAGSRSYTDYRAPMAGLEFTVFATSCSGKDVTLTGSSFDVATPNQTAASFTGRWTATPAATAYERDVRISTARGAAASYAGTWSNLGVVAAKGPRGGVARVYVDGVDKGTVNLYSPRAKARQVVFKAGFASTARHTVRVVNESGSATRNQVTLDGFAVIRRG